MKKLILGLSLALVYTLPSWAVDIQIGFENQSLLGYEEALKRYEAEKKDPQQAALANLLPFGTGSFQQGDAIGGLLISAVDIAALGALGGGLFSGNSFGLMIGIGWGIPIYAIGRFIGAISPTIHANRYNSELKKRLGLDHLDTNHDMNMNQANLYSTPTISFSSAF